MLLALLYIFAFSRHLYSAKKVMLVIKNPLANTGNIRDIGSTPGLGRSPGEGYGKQLLFLLRESHGQRSLADYSP